MKIIEVKEFKRYGSLELMQFGLIVQAVSRMSELGEHQLVLKFNSFLQASRVQNLLLGMGFEAHANYIKKETTKLIVRWGFLE